MSKLFSKEFKYTAVRDQGPDYLKKKFDKILAEMRKKIAAPQPSTAEAATGPSQEGLGQGDAAAAAPVEPERGSHV